ncbi:RNA polymerase II transcription factor B subunit 2 [Grifola frondosa]|uniref:RNA polymerase II transcription factor B subunit 2 n=1 Tax=Grifola frondosa TaxID=5627 RepID=A0A1C7M6J4_GRIFR|nr:RNA polymerase II transcription factor B subunit 2 [Grifola frondosa]
MPLLGKRPTWKMNPQHLNSSLSKAIVMPFDIPALTTFRKTISKKPYDDALSTLARLHILPHSPLKHALNGTFKTSLRQAITGGGTSGSFGVPAENDGKHPTLGIDSLDAYALERWETILYYMVSSGTGQLPAKPSQGVLYLLQRSGLMASVRGGTLQITSSGFQFLLHPPHEQLWELLLQYLHMAEERQMDVVEVLSFLFMLSSLELGQDYSAESLSVTQKAMLEDLRDYGLIRQRTATSRRFSPTRLATTLTSSSPPLPTSTGGGGSSSQTQGFIVLETNYRLYAYTENPLQIAVLNLFATLKSRFPNLVIGAITRESVKKALANGITADQIISYLTTHAHPQMRRNKPLLPVTVQDQIRLWELERNRVKSQEGYLYTAFASQADYEYVLNYAKQLDVVLWENPARRERSSVSRSGIPSRWSGAAAVRMPAEHSRTDTTWKETIVSAYAPGYAPWASWRPSNTKLEVLKMPNVPPTAPAAKAALQSYFLQQPSDLTPCVSAPVNAGPSYPGFADTWGRCG